MARVDLTNEQIKFLIAQTDMMLNSPSHFLHVDLKMINDMCDKLLIVRAGLKKRKKWFNNGK